MKSNDITVIVPCYNHEKYVLQCLKSIKEQTYKNFQWIVVDDGSKDNSVQILKEHQNEFGYTLICQANKGLAQTLTDIIKNYATGKYISICASDDYWVPNKLEIQYNFLEKNPQYAMCYGKTYDIDTKSNILGVSDSSKYKSGYIFNEIITQEFHPPVNYMYRKETLKEFNFFPANIIAEDFYMNCLIAQKYPIGFINEIQSYYRIAELSSKRDPMKLLKCHENTINIFQNTEIYNYAIQLQYLRNFRILSLYKKYKIASLKYGIKCISLFFKKDFTISIYHLIFRWIKC